MIDMANLVTFILLALGMVVPPDQTGAFVSGDLVDQVLTDQAEGWLAQAREQVPADVETSTHIGVYDSIAEGIIAEAQRLDAALGGQPHRVGPRPAPRIAQGRDVIDVDTETERSSL